MLVGLNGRLGRSGSRIKGFCGSAMRLKIDQTARVVSVVKGFVRMERNNRMPRGMRCMGVVLLFLQQHGWIEVAYARSADPLYSHSFSE